jgi:hypothetical protein
MSRFLGNLALVGSFLVPLVAVLIGCNQPDMPPLSKIEPSKLDLVAVTSASTATATNEEHPHIPGAHGGIIVPIGRDSYHAEAVVEKDGTLRLLMLGADESRIQEVEVQPVKAFVKAAGESDATSIELKALPQEGDSAGKTSQFVGKLPDAAVGIAVDVTIPNVRIGGERFRIGFTTQAEQHDTGMPAAVTGAEEQKLYFTPGGKYTQADIDANGKLSAGQKFRGFMSKHDMNPKPGDLICPVTFTKANPKVEWIVGGKKYTFCCPPCVDEFVRMAKEEPNEVKEPEEYVKRAQGSEQSSPTAKTEAVAPSIGEDAEVAAALESLSAEDRVLARSQKFCAVMTDNLLGSMGAPVKIDVNGQAVFLCCKGCKTKAINNADATLAAVKDLKETNKR